MHENSTPQPSLARPAIGLRRWPWVAAAVAAVVLAAGAGAGAMYLLGNEPANPSPAAVDSPSPASPPPNSPTHPAPSSPTTGTAHRLGQKVTVTGMVDVTVHAYKQPIPSVGKPEQAGHVWGAAEVSVCVRPDVELDIGIDEGPWSLVYADGSNYDPSDVRYGDHPLPQFPIVFDKATPAGRCVRGWIVFAVPADRRPQYIEYAPQSARTPVDWAP